MHIVVCVKMVPDTTQVKIDPETNTLIREGVPFITNPYDFELLIKINNPVETEEMFRRQDYNLCSSKNSSRS